MNCNLSVLAATLTLLVSSAAAAQECQTCSAAADREEQDRWSAQDSGLARFAVTTVS
jgi:hypothetical protein